MITNFNIKKIKLEITFENCKLFKHMATAIYPEGECFNCANFWKIRVLTYTKKAMFKQDLLWNKTCWGSALRVR